MHDQIKADLFIMHLTRKSSQTDMDKMFDYELKLMKALNYQLVMPTFNDIFEVLLLYCDEELGIVANEFKKATTYLFFSILRCKF